MNKIIRNWGADFKKKGSSCKSYVKEKEVKNGNNKFICINIHVYLSVLIFWLSKFLSTYLCVFGSVRWVVSPHGNRHGPCIFILSNFPLKFFHPLSLFVGQIWKHLYIYTCSYIHVHILLAILSSTIYKKLWVLLGSKARNSDKVWAILFR